MEVIMTTIQQAKYVGQYKIWLKFNDNQESIMDLVDIQALIWQLHRSLIKKCFQHFILTNGPRWYGHVALIFPKNLSTSV